MPDYEYRREWLHINGNTLALEDVLKQIDKTNLAEIPLLYIYLLTRFELTYNRGVSLKRNEALSTSSFSNSLLGRLFGDYLI